MLRIAPCEACADVRKVIMNHCIDCGIGLSNIPESMDHLHIFRCIRCFGHYEPVRPALTAKEKQQRAEEAKDMETATR